jgi:hypothetical protein
VVWAALAAVHVWPVGVVVARLAGGQTPQDFIALAVLLGITALFVLKAVDARWLRAPRPGLDLLVIAVAAALAHGDVVGRDGQSALSAETTTTVVVAAGGATLASRRLRHRLLELFRWLRSLARHSHRSTALYGSIGAARWPCPAGGLRCCALARAPPAALC